MGAFAKQLTLLIPTRDRSDFLVRLLGYYEKQGFEGPLCIADGSGPAHLDRAKRAIALFERKLEIVHWECAALDFAICLKQLVSLPRTPYVAFVSDDDFKVPKALEQCTAFLDEHPAYTGAHGIAVLFALSSGDAHGRMAWVGPYPLHASEADMAAERLRDLLRCYFSPLHSVLRKDVCEALFQDVEAVADRSLATEVIPSYLAVLYGKVKQLDCFYQARQVHDRRYQLPGVIERLKSPSFPESYRIFCERLVAELAHRDRLKPEEASQIVEHVWSVYLSNALKKQEHVSRSQRGWRLASRLRQIAGWVPGLRFAWHTLRGWMPGQDPARSLQALLRPSSPYHEDFLPIYRTVLTSASRHVDGG